MAREQTLLGKIDKRLPGGARVAWDDRAFLKVINKAMSPKLEKAANITANIARQDVPIGAIQRAASKYKSWKGRKPGSLLKSIKVRKSRFKDGGYIVSVGGRDTYYWYFVEYGTSKMGAQKFMRNAIKKAKYRIRGLF